jgi:hypothetical protein
MIELTETYRCPQCDGAVPVTNVKSRIVPDTVGPTTRTLQVYCEHCNAAWQAEFILRGLAWELSGQAQRITDKRTRKGLLDHLAKVRGMRQMALSA